LPFYISAYTTLNELLAVFIDQGNLRIKTDKAVARLLSFAKVNCISPPVNDSFRNDLCFTADVLFFYSNARSPRCVGRSARNGVRWSDLGRVL